MHPTIADFMETVPSTNERTRAHYVEALRQLETWAGVPLGELTENRLAGLMKRLRGMDSGQHYAGILRMFLGRFDMDTLAKKAVLRQRLKKIRPEEILTVAEVKTLIDAAGPTRNRAFIAALYETGVRVSELCALRREDIQERPANGGPAFYVLRFWKVKVTGEEHLGFVISTAPVMEAWLKIHPDPRPEAPLFPSAKGGPIGRKAGWHIVGDAARRAKIGKRVHPHTFRHSRATHLLQAGRTEAEVKTLMGWAPASTMLGRYAHLTGEDGMRAAFRAAGLEAPEEVKVDVLDFKDERLRPIVPLRVFPSVPGEPQFIRPQELAELLADPRVAAWVADPMTQRLLQVLGAVQSRPPA